MEPATLQTKSSSQQDKKSYLEELNNFRTKITALEKERISHLYNRRHELHSELRLLEETEARLNKEITKEKNDLRQKIEKIQTNLNHFKRMLRDMKTGPAFAEKIKKSLEEIESAMMDFKVQQKDVYEHLLKEERVLSQEIAAFEKRIESWLASQPPAIKDALSIGHLPTADKMSSLPPAVLAYERFLKQTGGHCGGWDQYDHQMFLKIRTNNFQSKVAFIEAAVHGIPTHTAEEVQQHEQWYTEYLALLESKKNAIREWKASKESVKTELAATASASDQQQWLHDSKLQQAKQRLLDMERKDRISKLSDWKGEKKRREKKEEEQRLLDKQSRAKRVERERERRAAIKKQLETYSRQREEKANERMLAEQAAATMISDQRRLANKHIHKFQERDEQAIKEKLEKQESKEKEKLELAERLERLKSHVSVAVTRDPSRLLQPTAGWEERTKTGTGSGMGGQLLSMPRRAVPSWRQGL